MVAVTLTRLQTGAVDDLDVDGELAAGVVEDKDADGATAGLEGAVEAGPEVGLVNDGQVGLDVAGLGHGGDVAVREVEDAVLLEDGAEHGLDNDAGGGVGDEGGLLVKLLGEEVDTEVAVLAGGGRGGDLDDLAGAALEDQEVTEADVVAGDGDGVGEERGTGVARGRRAGSTTDLGDLVAGGAAFMRVSNLVSQLVKTLAERVIMTWCGKHLFSSWTIVGESTLRKPRHTEAKKASQGGHHTRAFGGFEARVGWGSSNIPCSS